MSAVCTAAGVTALVLVSPIIAYVIARLVFTAYFFTKEQFNRRAENGRLQ